MSIARRYEILRGVVPSSRANIPVPERPVMVCVLLDENLLSKYRVLSHGRAVFIEDRGHDWHWSEGCIRYTSVFGGAGNPRDIVLVYEEVDGFDSKPLFDPETGEKLCSD